MRGLNETVRRDYRNEMQVHIVSVILLQRDGDAERRAGGLARWQAVYPQEGAEGPLQLHKAAELMATVMAWLHLESCEFDCRSAAWPLALPQLKK